MDIQLLVQSLTKIAERISMSVQLMKTSPFQSHLPVSIGEFCLAIIYIANMRPAFKVMKGNRFYVEINSYFSTILVT